MILKASSPAVLILKRIYWSIMDALPDRLAVKIQHYRAFRVWLDIENPRTFSEKIQWRKFYQCDPRFPVFADKIAVKEEMAKLIGAQHIIPTLWAGEKAEEIPFGTLKPPYVIKTNHGSGNTLFVRSPADVDQEKIIEKISPHLRHDYGHVFREWAYYSIPRRVLVEPMICDENGDTPQDYKVFVFNGRARLIQVDTGRYSNNHRRDFFDRNWKRQVLTDKKPPSDTVRSRPERLDELIELAEKVGALFDFVRADFYIAPTEILFGEVTFYPGGGYCKFDPPEWENIFGDWWVLSKNATYTKTT